MVVAGRKAAGLDIYCRAGYTDPRKSALGFSTWGEDTSIQRMPKRDTEQVRDFLSQFQPSDSSWANSGTDPDRQSCRGHVCSWRGSRMIFVYLSLICRHTYPVQ